MAQITVVYKDFEEMKEVARYILGIKEEDPSMPNPEAVSAAEAEPAINMVPVNTAPEQTTASPTSAILTAPVTPAVPITPSVPTSTREYTLDELARAGMTLMDAGRQAEVQGLLTRFGVTVLPALPKEQYGAFATALREMGAQI